MREFHFVVTDPVGIHARPAGELVKYAKQFESKILVKKGDKSSDMKALLKLMAMGVRQGDEIEVTVEGADEADCAEKLEAYLKEKF